jgi:hypothetical protein
MLRPLDERWSDNANHTQHCRTQLLKFFFFYLSRFIEVKQMRFGQNPVFIFISGRFVTRGIKKRNK